MKTTMMMLLAAALAAGSALAQQGEGPQTKGKACGGEGWGKQAWGQKDWHGDRPGGPLSPEMMAQRRADHHAIRELGDAARAETDEAKKAELVTRLRAKLGEIADRIQTQREQRLAQAEERLAGLKEKIEDSKANRDARIEEQIQRILSGERPPRPAAFDRYPQAKGGHGPGVGHSPCGSMPPPPPPGDEDIGAPPPAGDGGLAPLPEEEMPGDMPAPPPPEE